MGCPAVRPSDLAERLGAAVDYIEDHLDEEVRLDEAARRAGYSPWHFIRVFQLARGISPLEYARRRRLSCAATALLTGRPLIDVALDFGYGSQGAFTRAFTRAFSISPGAYRRRALQGHPSLRLTHLFEPRLPWPIPPAPEPRLVERPPSRFIGIPRRVPTRRFQTVNDLPGFWTDWLRRQRWREVPGRSAPGDVDRGHALLRPDPRGDVEYVIGVDAEPSTPVPPDWRVYRIPGGLYACFEAIGDPLRTPQAIALGVYVDWMNRTPFRRRMDGWDLERFDRVPDEPPDRLRCALWFPVEA